MDTVKITFNDGSVHEYIKGTTFYDVSKDSNIPNIVAFKKNNEVYSLHKKAVEDVSINFINTDDVSGNRIYKSGLKFLFQVALKELYPKLDVCYEHSVPRGFLGKIKGDIILTNDDIAKIKGKMCEIIDEDERIIKMNVTPKEAIKFYEKRNEFEKAQNIQNISDKAVIVYKLKNYYNYFYSQMPYSTKIINKFELIYLGNNKIVFMYPLIGKNANVDEYVHYGNIIDAFEEGKSWLGNLNMAYVANLNGTIGSGKIKDFIKSTEIKFNMDIAKVASRIIEKKNTKLVLIAGPSSSGKTTTTKRLSSYLEANGYEILQISLDDYFKDRDKTPKDSDGNYDFERIDAIDVELFNEDLDKLINGERICLPKYNFITGKRDATKHEVSLGEKGIILIEGLHALNDDLTKNIDDQYKYKVYLSPFIPLSIDKQNYISTLDLRLLRRIVRDNRTRGYSVADTIKTWQSVRRGEEKYIFPYIHQADAILNTALAYEIGVLKVFVEPLLLSVSVNLDCYAEARRLIDFLKQFFAIPGEYVNDESILREFIGGKYND